MNVLALFRRAALTQRHRVAHAAEVPHFTPDRGFALRSPLQQKNAIPPIGSTSRPLFPVHNSRLARGCLLPRWNPFHVAAIPS